MMWAMILGLLYATTAAPTPRPVRELNTADTGAFGVLQIATTDPERLARDWSQPTAMVHVTTQRSATRNQPILTAIIFHGCTADGTGTCHVAVRFSVIDPAGKAYCPPQDLVVWDAAPPPGQNIQMGRNMFGIRIDPGEALGNYRVVAQTTDLVAHVTLTTEQTLAIGEAPVADRWEGVTEQQDHDVTSAAKALIALLPQPHAAIARIETALRQAAAETRYRLVLRLADGSRMSGDLTHRSSGAFEVAGRIDVQ